MNKKSIVSISHTVSECYIKFIIYGS